MVQVWPPAALQAQVLASIVEVAAAGQIKGGIATTDGSPVEFVNVMLHGTSKGSISAADGSFIIRNVKAGDYTLVATYVGLEAKQQEVRVSPGQTTSVNPIPPRQFVSTLAYRF